MGEHRALPAGSVRAGASLAPRQPPLYLGHIETYRVIACSAVVLQHSLLWTLTVGNVAGWAFVMLLHFSRTAFFFLTAFLLTYAQMTRPVGPVAFWRRRYVQLGVPYLAWTLGYWLYSVLAKTSPTFSTGGLLLHDVTFGYYQLYVVVVLFQLYLVFPLLYRFLAGRRHHLAIMAASAAFALALAFAIHWPASLGPLGRAVVGVERYWPWSRDLLTYQEQFVAGVLVALNYEAVHRAVLRWYRWILGAAAVAGIAATLWYLGAVWSGSTVGFASSLYQPVAFLWFSAVVAALECATWHWYRRASSRGGTTWSTSIAPRLAELTGGVFFCHVFFIDLMREALRASGLLGHLGWAGGVVVLFVLTASSSALFVALILRTPLRWVLGGPVRAEQRARLAGTTEPVRSADAVAALAGFGVPGSD